MCRCGNYPRTTMQGDCTVCGAGFYESFDEWRDCINADSAGFVETDSPVTILAYVDNRENPIEIKGVNEESISFEIGKGNVRILTFEFADKGMRIGYVPGLTYFVTV
jgi:hypothetical protein